MGFAPAEDSFSPFHAAGHAIEPHQQLPRGMSAVIFCEKSAFAT